MIFIADLPPQLHEQVSCSIEAAAAYDLPANVLLAVAEQEGGRPGQWVENTNKTFDVGPLQFNTAYLKDLAKYGIAPEDVAEGGCYSYYLAAWRIQYHVRHDNGEFWTRVANYHSKTPAVNEAYRQRLLPKAAKWGRWIDEKMRNNEGAAVDTSRPPMPFKRGPVTTKLSATPIKVAPVPDGTPAFAVTFPETVVTNAYQEALKAPSSVSIISTPIEITGLRDVNEQSTGVR